MKRNNPIMNLYPVPAGNQLLVTPYNIFLVTPDSWQYIKNILRFYNDRNYMKITEYKKTFIRITIKEVQIEKETADQEN